MPRRPVVSWKDISRLLNKLGYTLIRQKGSHMIFSFKGPKEGYGKVTIPKHKEIDPRLRDEIINAVSKHTGISEDDLVEMLK